MTEDTAALTARIKELEAANDYLRCALLAEQGVSSPYVPAGWDWDADWGRWAHPEHGALECYVDGERGALGVTYTQVDSGLEAPVYRTALAAMTAISGSVTKAHDPDMAGWQEIYDAGLLWWINSTLHLFGWAIYVITDDDDRVLHAEPLRTASRGFPEFVAEDGYRKLTRYTSQHMERLLSDVAEDDLDAEE